ncbi:MAG: hypothetical protein IT427_20945 [Pirellulales bacterium]|nr:hypothetical protein [Pirellulales bacterium]
MHKWSQVFLIVASACLTVAVGCGKSTDGFVSGSVTWKGEPLPYGYIMFASVDGKTNSAGSLIEAGKYRATNVPPGEKVVQVTSSDPPRIVQTSTDKMKPPAIDIPENAKGNGEKHTIRLGEQTLDFALAPPK